MCIALNYKIIIFPLIIFVDGCLSLCRFNKPANFTQIAVRLGYSVQKHDVITQDGYILKLFRIPGNRSKPILLMHGFIDSADTFIVRENASLATALSDAGYDVWLGNTRGNKYSRRHQYLNPDIDKEFWDFSFHELGYYDLPAMIDYVLDKTSMNSLTAIGHSQGTTIFLVLGATRPDYNDKITLMVALAPISFLNNLKNSVSHLLNAVPVIDQLITIFGEEEIFGDNMIITRLFKCICKFREFYNFCANGLILSFGGSDPVELEPEFFSKVLDHYPTGTSKKNGLHLYQISKSKSFAEFDYGPRNMDIYDLSNPPDYDLTKVTMKVGLVVGRNDKISTLEDVELLNEKLPNVVDFTVLQRKKINHVDMVWGRNMRMYLFPTIFDILSKYG